MNDALIRYYEVELAFIRQLVQEFARKYPGVASRLLLQAHSSADPQVERLIESSALLAGRVQQRLDDEFPEITIPLLEAIYPHFLAPIPSLGLLQFELDPVRAQSPAGFTIPRHSRLLTQPVDGVACEYRTCYEVKLWPVRLTEAAYREPPLPRGWSLPDEKSLPEGKKKPKAALRLLFECSGTLKLPELVGVPGQPGLEVLRLYLHGERQFIPSLYEMVFNNALQVVFGPVEPETGPAPFSMNPSDCLVQAGFEAAESLFPYPPQSRLGLRLLSELFLLPEKFCFLDLRGWDRVRRRGWQRKCQVVVFFERALPELEQAVEAGTFRQGSTPVVNLFQPAPVRVPLQRGKTEYPIVPDETQKLAYEVYSVDAVRSTDPVTNVTRDFAPFFSIEHRRNPDLPEVFWHMARRPSLKKNDHGTLVSLHLVDGDFNPRMPGEAALDISTTCTNRDLPAQLRRAGEQVAFNLLMGGPVSDPRSLRPLTPPLRPRQRDRRLWQLISHQTLHSLSMTDDDDGLEAMRAIVALYDFSDQDAGHKELELVTREFSDGITGVSHQRVIGRLTREGLSSFCRGVEITVELDEEKYFGVGPLLFASVLERFFGLYVSSNSFTQLVARTKKRRDVFKRWPPRPGELPTM